MKIPAPRPVGKGRSRPLAARPQPVMNGQFEKHLKDCEEYAQSRLETRKDFWARVTSPDALLLHHLLRGTLPGKKDEIIAAYQKAFETGARPSEVDSVLSQIDFIRTLLNHFARTEDQKSLVTTLHEIKVSLLTSTQAAS
jgi:hypothetical protein